ncbi:iron ABC transporter permease [Tatumella terrea]|uniref:FecCD family ABC transporter permease n=1 Tax=Tatumella terrea TaxID=419007 RepID=A0ABW1VSV7_9GAMM|nr:iron ABC transporter permease [Tatumella sp. JGM118]MBS0910760.1 iron ABC transporter permease [Tatumella sp. JGM118]
MSTVTESVTRERGGIGAEYRKLIRKRVVLLLVLVMAICCSVILDFTIGPAHFDLMTLLRALVHPAGVDAATRVIVWDIRLPFTLMAVVVGFALGMAGSEMQTILNNPLASPFTLGVSSAASFGAALALVLGVGIPGIPGTWLVTGNAFIFAILTAFILNLVSRRTVNTRTTVVLFGIALVFTFNALVAMMQFIASEDTLQSLVFWTMGSLGRASWPKLGILAAAIVILLPWALKSAWQLTALRLGEDRAASFGIDVARLRMSSLIRISLASALAVAFVGPIGFIGLVAPHIARQLVGEDHRFYLPASGLIGALVLSLASVVSKNIVPGVIIPIGIITSLVGVPFFIVIILRHRGNL